MMNNIKKGAILIQVAPLYIFYTLNLVEAKKDLQASVDARKAHEGQR